MNGLKISFTKLEILFFKRKSITKRGLSRNEFCLLRTKMLLTRRVGRDEMYGPFGWMDRFIGCLWMNFIQIIINLVETNVV
jgi:hypothetical protein